MLFESIVRNEARTLSLKLIKFKRMQDLTISLKFK